MLPEKWFIRMGSAKQFKEINKWLKNTHNQSGYGYSGAEDFITMDGEYASYCEVGEWVDDMYEEITFKQFQEEVLGEVIEGTINNSYEIL